MDKNDLTLFCTDERENWWYDLIFMARVLWKTVFWLPNKEHENTLNIVNVWRIFNDLPLPSSNQNHLPSHYFVWYQSFPHLIRVSLTIHWHNLGNKHCSTLLSLYHFSHDLSALADWRSSDLQSWKSMQHSLHAYDASNWLHKVAKGLDVLPSFELLQEDLISQLVDCVTFKATLWSVIGRKLARLLSILVHKCAKLQPFSMYWGQF